MALILSCATKQQVESLKSGEWPEVLCIRPHRLRFIDSHIHIDMITKDKLLGVEQTLMELSNLPFLQLAIANFVYPSSWMKIEDTCLDSRFVYTIGIHPHMTKGCKMSPRDFLDVVKSEEKCVGIGEVGLDYTTSCRCHEHHGSSQKEKCRKEKIKSQKAFLEDLLPQLHVVKTVLVIHTNGEGAAMDMIKMLEKHDLKNQAIHWHCFSGDQTLATQLLKFPNLKFSISSMVLSQAEVKQAIRVIPLNHLILETDAPYLDPVSIAIVKRKQKGLQNMLWSLVLHGKAVGEIKNLPLDVMLEISNDNILSLYDIPVTSISVDIPPKVNLQAVHFQGKSNVLSNMYPCKIKVRGKTFHGTEQAYHFQRAADLGHWEAQLAIGNSKDGFEAKKAGKLIPKYRKNMWNPKHAVPVMEDLIEAKFDQVKEFRKEVIASGTKLLMEATLDTFWGIGTFANDADPNIELLKGNNVLGWLIMAHRMHKCGYPIDHLYYLYQCNKDIPFYKGIAYVLGLM